MINFPQNNWNPIFKKAEEKGLFTPVFNHLAQDSKENKIVYPPLNEIFRAFELCDLNETKVVILGQDPYHGHGEANGLAFSVNDTIKTPPSLRNIFKELKQEYPTFNFDIKSDLSDWSNQGVMLLNSVLSVEKDKAASHSKYGWQNFTDYIISEISDSNDFVVYILLGNFAKSKTPLINSQKHSVLTTSHPSPLSVYRGFLGSNIFLQCNKALKSKGMKEILW